MRDIDFIVVHGAWTPASMDIGVHTIRQWHILRGFKDVGYHFIICRDGETQIGRKMEEVGAHVKGFNANSIGICLVGGAPDAAFVKDNPADPTWEFNYTAEQLASLASLVAYLTLKYPKAVVQGHRDFPEVVKRCPGFDVAAWYNKGKWRDFE